MTFLVIAADEPGTLRLDPRVPTYEVVRAEASGDYGADRVQPRYEFGVVGWVHGNGHAEGLPRNIVGSLVMTALGYKPYPLAGPVVITGYDPRGGGETRSITPRELAPVLGAYAGVLDALGVPVPEVAAKYRHEALADEKTVATFRDVAAALRDVPTPGMTSRTVW